MSRPVCVLLKGHPISFFNCDQERYRGSFTVVVIGVSFGETPVLHVV